MAPTRMCRPPWLNLDRFTFGFVGALVAVACGAHAEVQIERTVLPLGATPSSFAIGLPGGASFCWDPVRAALSYAWKGGYIDITSVRPGPGKKISEVKLLGPVVYQETGPAPLRRGDPKRLPTVELKGYVLRDSSIEFRYTVDGALVGEEIATRADGAGLVRHFNVAGASDASWWYVVDGRPPVALAPAGAREFTLQVPFGKPAP